MNFSKIKAIAAHTTAPSIAAVLLGFALWPLPQIEGNPTGFKFFVRMYMEPDIDAIWAQVDRVHTNVETGNLVQYFQYQKDEHMEVLIEIEEDCVKDDADNQRCKFRIKRWDAENEDLIKKIDHFRSKQSSEIDAIQLYAKHP